MPAVANPFFAFFGLPTHVLVVHAVVVLTPLAVVMVWAYLARPGWRTVLAWPTAVMSVLAGGSAFVAASSGEELEGRLSALGSVPASLHEHTEAGDLARLVIVVFMVIVLATIFWALPARSARVRSAALRTGAIVVAALAGLAAVVVTVQAGHTGAAVAWGPIMSQLGH